MNQFRGCTVSHPTQTSASEKDDAENPISTLQSADLQGLLQLCLNSRHDESLWSEFIRRTRPLIVRVITRQVRRRCRPTPSLVDDLVQDTYLKLCSSDFKALREFDGEHENAFYGFLKVVATRVVHDHVRGVYCQKRGSGRENESLDHISSMSAGWRGRAGHEAEHGILLREIRASLENRASEPTFSRDYAIFWLYYWDGWTANAIAALPSVGLSVKGVESTLLRLTRNVRSRMSPHWSATVNN